MIKLLRTYLDHRISLKYLVCTALITFAVFVIGFAWIARQQEKHIMDQVKKQAVILQTQIMLTRLWVAEHHTVLVPRTEDTPVTPFLKDPHVVGDDGRVYTKISPSVLTKLLSEKAGARGLYSFRLAGDRPLNPENASDAFETEAIAQFRQSRSKRIFRTEERAGRRILRYAAPVYVTRSCRDCHMVQGYQVGDISGCLSLFVPLDEAQAAIDRNRFLLLAGSTILACCLVFMLFAGTRFMVFNRISEIKSALSRMTSRKEEPARDDSGDELQEIRDFCYLIDEELQSRHEALEQQIADATRDLSEANAELTRLNQAKMAFFSDISHELRTPLTSIKGAADLLERKISCDDPKYLEIIRRNADYLLKTVLDFFDYSRIESGQVELELTEGSLRAVAEEVALSQQADAQQADVRIVVGGDEGFAAFDHQRIYQVFANLVANAVRFSPPGSKIRVLIGGHNGEVEAVVQDEGPGIEPEYRAAIFERFYQIAGSHGSAGRKASAGIGLAICKGLVEAHGGAIWVTSRSNRGSEFHFTLPCPRRASSGGKSSS